MIGLDTSFLVGLAIREHPSHARCLAVFEAEIKGGTATMALVPQVLAEFCHVVTDPRRFERPLAMTDALDLSGQWWNAQECRQLSADPEVSGVSRMASTDWRDFERYGVFEVIAV